LNPQPADYKSAALPIELHQQTLSQLPLISSAYATQAQKNTTTPLSESLNLIFIDVFVK
jgi:hypothetical protein